MDGQVLRVKQLLDHTAAMFVSCYLGTMSDHSLVDILFMLFLSQLVQTYLNHMVSMNVQSHLQHVLLEAFTYYQGPLIIQRQHEAQ